MRRVFLLAVLLAAALAAPAAGRRIVAVGDIHGAFDALRALLATAELIDGNGEWAGGDAVFVQTGDFLDRGAGAIRVAQWLMDLQQQAPGKGGEVIVLLGNHEVMNMMGDMRDVTAAIVEPLADGGSKKRRAEMCKKRVAIQRAGAKALGQKPPPASSARELCLEEHPLGLVEYYESLRPEAPLGRWLRSRPAAVQIDDVVFVHGGISPEAAGLSLEEINQRVYLELAEFEDWRRWLIANEKMVAAGSLLEMARAVQILLNVPADNGQDPDDAAAPDLRRFFDLSNEYLLSAEGPLWFRGYATWSEEEGLVQMPPILDALGARYIVSGHTPQQAGRIMSRFDNRVFLIDTGMLAAVYRGAPAALQFVDGRVEAIYLDKKVVLHKTGE